MENVKRLNAYQDPFGSAWLNVVPSKNLGLKLTDQQLRISLSLRLGAKICDQDLIAKSNGPIGNELLQKLTSVLNIVLEVKIPVGLRLFFFGAKLIGLRKKDGGVRPIAVGNTLRRICSKCVSSLATDQRQIDFYGTQFGCGTSRGAEIAAHVFRTIIENKKNPENVILKMDFKNASNSLKRDKMLDTVFRKRRQLYNYTHSAYSETSHLFKGVKVIQSQEGCQQEDPECPALDSDTIQDLVNQMVSQYNVWYLDDGNLSDHYRTVLDDLKRIIASVDDYGLSLVKTKYHLIFLGKGTESSKKRIKTLFEEDCPGIEVEYCEKLERLGSPMGANARRVLLNKKMIELQRLSEVVTKLDAH